MGLTRKDQFLLHDVDVSTGPPDCCAQHYLFRVVAVHPAHPIPEIKQEVRYKLETLRTSLYTAASAHNIQIRIKLWSIEG